MSLKDGYTIRFLIIGLCSSSANSRFGIILFLISPPEDYQKMYKPLKQDFFDIRHIF